MIKPEIFEDLHYSMFLFKQTLLTLLPFVENDLHYSMLLFKRI